MSLAIARNVSLLLMLAAFPLVSIGTSGGQPALWWMGLASLGIGSAIPPLMRYLPGEAEEEPHQPTDLGDSCRVC